MNTTRPRVHNFSSGPVSLPLPVLEALARHQSTYRDFGVAPFEVSHRSAPFEALMASIISDLLALSGAGDEFSCLLLHGGASLCFSTIPLNLLGDDPKKVAYYLQTGHWSQKASFEASRLFGNQIKSLRFEDLDKPLSEPYQYLHYCNNETLDGLTTSLKKGSRHVIDATSSILIQPVSWDWVDVLYVSTQKQLGVAGLCVVFIRKTLLKDLKPHPLLPINLNFKAQDEAGSLLATPPSMSIFVLRLMLDWIMKEGLSTLKERSEHQAKRLYEFLDQSSFYQPFIKETNRRSTLNIAFKTPSKELDELFCQEAEKRQLIGLKGHRVQGGIRAGLYFGVTKKGVESLMLLLKEFEKKYYE